MHARDTTKATAPVLAEKAVAIAGPMLGSRYPAGGSRDSGPMGRLAGVGQIGRIRGRRRLLRGRLRHRGPRFVDLGCHGAGYVNRRVASVTTGRAERRSGRWSTSRAADASGVFDPRQIHRNPERPLRSLSGVPAGHDAVRLRAVPRTRSARPPVPRSPGCGIGRCSSGPGGPLNDMAFVQRSLVEAVPRP
jgi:hypothetical protein